MMQISFNDESIGLATVEELGVALDRFANVPRFELWFIVPGGASVCMLRAEVSALLIYWRYPGDTGFHSVGDPKNLGNQSFLLSNGNIELYPLSWCIDIDECLKVIAYFFVNDGRRPEWVGWCELRIY